jgi:hypothetical protein
MRRPDPHALMRILAACLLFSGPLVSAQEIDCATLQDAISGARTDFAAFRGARQELPADPDMEKAMALMDLTYSREAYAASRQLSEGTTCSVIVARAEDADAATANAQFECAWPGAEMSPAQFDGIKKALRDCVTNPMAEEDDPDTFILYVDRVESGEGWGAVFVSADRQAVLGDSGASVAVAHVVCESKTLGGCDEED